MESYVGGVCGTTVACMKMQFRRADVTKAGDEADESRKADVVDMVTSEEAVPDHVSFAEVIQECITTLRELAKVIISFGQVLSSFAYV